MPITQHLFRHVPSRGSVGSMLPAKGSWTATILVGFVVGCGGESSVALEDSAGDSFDVSCDENACSVQPRTDVPLPDCAEPRAPGYSFVADRFVAVTAACVDNDGSWTSLQDWERPVICETSDDCPSLLGEDFECRVGLCQNEDVARWPLNEVTQGDVWLLCLGPVARVETIDLADGLEAHLAVQALVDEACGDGVPAETVCATPLPSGCLQPL